MQRSFVFVCLLVVCLVCLGPLAAQEDTARVRIGYIAFDPREYDTFINGEPALFGRGWDTAGWLGFVTPGTEGAYVCCSATPYMHFPAGTYSFAFAPRGGSLEDAVSGPFEVTLAPGHLYSLAIVGEIEDGSLNVLTIDETEAYSSPETTGGFREIMIHDLQGLGTLNISNWSPDDPVTVDFNQYAAGWWPTGSALAYVLTTTEDPAEEMLTLYENPAPEGLSNLAAFTGVYPGTWSEDFLYFWNYQNTVEATMVDGGPITLGEEIAAELAVGQRVQYSLTLDADQALNIYARVTGGLTAGWDLGYFDTYVYVYDTQGNLLLWNDDLASAVGVAGMEGVLLSAGDYMIEVGSFTDTMAGPFALLVEAAE